MAGGKPAPGRSAKQVAARAEVNGNGLRTVETQGLKLTVTATIPFAVLRYIRKDAFDMVAVLEMLLDPPEQIDKVWDANLSLQDGAALVTDLVETGGVSVGESLASPDS